MNCVFYVNNSLENKINKNITLVDTKTILFLESVDVFNMHIRIKESVNANYCLINGKYYFISDKKILRNDLFEYTLKEDVLMTFKNELLNTQCEVIECQNNFDDDNVSYSEKQKIERTKINIENPFNDDSIILVTVQ